MPLVWDELERAGCTGITGVWQLATYFGLFLVVRGLPALLLYRHVLPESRDRFALASYSATALPLVVAITTVAVEDGHMRPSTAAALLGAAIISTIVFPFLGRALRRPQMALDAMPASTVGEQPASAA